jgi:hypothetical protein
MNRDRIKGFMRNRKERRPYKVETLMKKEQALLPSEVANAETMFKTALMSLDYPEFDKIGAVRAYEADGAGVAEEREDSGKGTFTNPHVESYQKTKVGPGLKEYKKVISESSFNKEADKKKLLK